MWIGQRSKERGSAAPQLIHVPLKPRTVFSRDILNPLPESAASETGSVGLLAMARPAQAHQRPQNQQSLHRYPSESCLYCIKIINQAALRSVAAKVARRLFGRAK